MDNNNDNHNSIFTKTLQSNKQNPITVKKRESSKRGNYILGETIGQGAFAKVKLATHMYTQEKVAIKILNKTKLIEKSKDILRIQKEINILKRLRHKNIIHLYEIMESASSLYIVMDFCEGKELFDFIIKRKRLTEREACRFFQQIINGVEYLHLQNITHRDLKPENLLLDSKKRIKISDFGLSTISDESNSLLQTACGTPSYAPPEMLRGDEYLGVPSDIWSCGIILYTMLCGNLPCVESKEELIYQCFLNKTFDFPSYLSANVVDLLERLLKFNPNERIGFDQIKRHPWFNLVQPQMKPGIILGVHKIPIDEQIMNQVELFGYDKQMCYESVTTNRYDEYCAIYYFLLKKCSREGRGSISDMHSEEYERYIRNSSNWLHIEDIKNAKYKDYWIERTVSRNEINKLNRAYLINRDEGNNTNYNNSSQGSVDDRLNDNYQSCSVNSNNNSNNQMIETYCKMNIDDELKRSMMIGSDNDDTSMNSCNYNNTNGNSNNHNITIITSNSNNQLLPKQITFTSSSKKTKQINSFYPQSQSQSQSKCQSQSKPEKHFIFNLNKDRRADSNGDRLVGINDDELLQIDKLNDNAIQSLKQKLIQSNTQFNKDMNIIDNYDNKLNIVVPQIAKKLIKTTIFSKYLLRKMPQAKLNKADQDELQEKFYLIQKFKSLVEIIKSTKINVFPKKIYDWNYHAFEDYLYEDEDYILGDSFINSNINNAFIDNLQQSIKLRNRFNPRRFLSKNFSSKKTNSLFKCSLFSRLRNNHKVFDRLRKNKRSIVMPISSYINDTSLDKSISHSLNDTLGSQKHSNTNQHYNQHSLYLNSSAPYKSKYSSSTMNDISEDEELLQLNSYSPDVCNTNSNNSNSNHPLQQNRAITIKGIPMSRIPIPLSENILNNDVRARVKYINLNNGNYNNKNCSNSNSLFLIENKTKLNQTSISSIKSDSNPGSKRRCNVLNVQSKQISNKSPSPTASPSPSPSRNTGVNNAHKPRIVNDSTGLNAQSFLQLSSLISTSTVLSASSIKSNNAKVDNCKWYDGPIDFLCVLMHSKETLLQLLKQYFKKIQYFCKVNQNTIKCSKANINFEIEIMMLKGTSMYYLKIKEKKGEGIQYQKTIYGLIRHVNSH